MVLLMILIIIANVLLAVHGIEQNALCVVLCLCVHMSKEKDRDQNHDDNNDDNGEEDHHHQKE